MKRAFSAALISVLLFCLPASADTVTVDPEVRLHGISPSLYGIFLEDINCAVDGGLYAELIKNRSFENAAILSPKHADRWEAWKTVRRGNAAAELSSEAPIHENNPTYLHVTLGEGDSLTAVNQGFGGNALRGGIPVREGEEYDLSLWLRLDAGVTVTAALTEKSGAPLGEGAVFSFSGEGWQRCVAVLDPGRDADAVLSLTCEGIGCADIDMASLMSADRVGADWPGGGLRRDLVEALAELKPRFLRFPGGCVVEGSYVRENAYDWKAGVGNAEERREIGNTWGGMQTMGVGFYEYFCLAEYLGALPVPVVHAGVLCQAREALDGPLTMEETAAYAQDILDLIEFALGGADTVWGGLRVRMGHPEPFDLRYIAIGNENWGGTYFDRYAVLRNAVKEKYPDVTCIVSAGPVAEGSLIRDSWSAIRRRFPEDLAEEHYYMDSAWFPAHADRYDAYPRTTEVFLGEYAAHEALQGNRRPSDLYAALCEAAFLTGIERNSDLVRMCCYAPLLCREGAADWTPDLVFFNDDQVLLTPGWHVQRMFSLSLGDTLIQSACDGALFHTASTRGDKIIVKLVNLSGNAVPVILSVQGAEDGEAQGEMLTGYDRGDVNSFARPDRIAPIAYEACFCGGRAEFEMPAWSLLVLTVGTASE